MQHLRRLASLVPIVLLVCLLLPTSSEAQQTSGVISACVGKYTGLTRIVGATEACHSWETRLQWNIAGPGVPGDVTVSCPGQTITQALESSSGRPLTITVNGTCTENVVITRDDVTLRGAAGAALTGPDPTQDTILIRGARRVIIGDLTVSGGNDGIKGAQGATFTVEHSTIANTPGSGIAVTEHSQAEINDNTITRNGADGVRLNGGSNAAITANVISANGKNGISIREGSTARVGFSYAGLASWNTIERNQAFGLEIWSASTALLYGNTVQENNVAGLDAGIGLYYNSVAYLIGGNNVTKNTGVGIGVRNSTLRVSQGDWGLPVGPNEITSNTGGGIAAEENCYVDLRDGVTVSHNTGYGLSLRAGIRVRMRDTTVTGNDSGGIQIWMASSIRFLSNSNVTGNAGYSLDCRNNGGPSYFGTFLGMESKSPECSSF